jgi:hypothetical protein
VDPSAKGSYRASRRAGCGVTDATASCTVVLICDTHDGGGRSVENVERCGVWDDVVVGFEEVDVSSAELLNATFVLLAMTGVLADSQKAIECNGRQITAHCCFVRRGVHPDRDEMVDYGDRDGEFVLGRGIVASGRFDEALDAEPVLTLTAIGGVGWRAVPPTRTSCRWYRARLEWSQRRLERLPRSRLA